MGQSPSRTKARSQPVQPLLQSKGLAIAGTVDEITTLTEESYQKSTTALSERQTGADRAPIINLETNHEFETNAYSSISTEDPSSPTAQPIHKSCGDDSEVKLEVASVTLSANSSETALKILEDTEAQAGSKQSLAPTIIRGILQNGSELKKDRRVSIMVAEDCLYPDEKLSKGETCYMAKDHGPSPIPSNPSTPSANSSSTIQISRRRSRLIAPDPHFDDGSKNHWKTPSRSNTRSSIRSVSITSPSTWGSGSRRASVWSTATQKDAASERSRGRPGTSKSRKTKSIQFSMGSTSSIQGSQGQLSQSTSSMPDEDSLFGSTSQLVTNGRNTRPSRKSSVATSHGSQSLMDTLSIPHASSGDISAIVEEDDTITDSATNAKTCKCGALFHKGLSCEEATSALSTNESPNDQIGDQHHTSDHQNQHLKWKARKKREKEHQALSDGRHRRESNSSQLSDASGGKVDASTAALRESTTERSHDFQRSMDHLASRDSIAAARQRNRAPSMKTAASSFVGSQFLTSDIDRHITKRQYSRKESVWSDRTKKLMISNRKMSMELEEMKYTSLIASLPRVASIWELEPM
ncbi:hypothetical protein HDU67_010289 [Dinochytrium kinnereticum]|nr:hypothetical protein HDU67_010289 [Dinochytrium kinnereticum]